MDAEKMLKTPSEHIQALLYLYKCQTLQERATRVTVERNNSGFNMIDADFLSSLAQWVKDGRRVTDKQMASLELRLPKYRRQLADGAWRSIVVPETAIRIAPPAWEEEKPKSEFTGRLEIDPRTKGFVLIPNIFPSKQIKTIAPFFWQDQAWHQAKPEINQFIVDQIIKLFGKVDVAPEVTAALAQPVVELPDEIANHPVLFPFQKETIEFAIARKHSMIALAPGLGKTACAIFSAQAAKCQKILVVAPLSLVFNWRNEIKKWTGESAIVWYQKQLPIMSKWVVTNYDTIRIHPDQFLKDWDAIIVDESISIKNRHTIRTKVVTELISKTKPEYAWLLSGAPVSKFYDDMWSQLHAIEPKRFSSYWRFAQRYCFVEQNQWGWQIVANQPDASERINSELSDLYFARTQDQVLDLPDWIIEDVHVPMDTYQDKVYASMEEEFMADLTKDSKLVADNILAQITRLVQLASNPVLVGGKDTSAKWKACVEMLEYEQGPFIIWTSFIQTADKLAAILRANKYSVAILNGSVPGDARQKIVDSFQAGEIDVIIAHPAAGKFGFTLTAARTAIYLERNYNGDDYYQSLHRIRRIGTKFSPHIIHLISDRADQNNGSTVDSVIGKILQNRRDNVLKLTSGELKQYFEEARK